MTLCSAKKISLICQEKFFGDDHEHEEIESKIVSEGVCKTSERSRISPFGPLSQRKSGIWSTFDHHTYKCKWMRTKRITFVHFTIREAWGYIKGESKLIHQSLSKSHCMYDKFKCLPLEDLDSVIIWARVRHIFKVFKEMGVFEISEINKFVLIAQLAEGGSIVKETRNSKLLNNGLVILKGVTNNISRIDWSERQNFVNLSKKFSASTDSSIQLNLLGGKMGLELLRANKMLSILAGAICKTNAKMRRFQSILLEHFPEAGTNLLFGRSDRLVEMVGDAMITKRCLKVSQFNITWARMKNDTCFFHYPISSPQIGDAFLELRSRRILRSSHRIPCSERLETIYVSDKEGTFWSIALNGSKVVIPHIIKKDSEEGLVLPLLAEFNFETLHRKIPKPGRESLMEILGAQTDNLEQLYVFKEKGEGSLGDGIATVIAGTIEATSKAGTSLISSIVKGTSSLVGSTADSITKIIGGIPNLVLFALNLVIIGYLCFQRWEMMNYRRPRGLDASQIRVIQPIVAPPVPERSSRMTETVQ